MFDDLVEAIFNNNKVVKEDNNKIVKEDNNKIVNEDNNKIVNENNNVNDNEDNNINDNEDNNVNDNEDNKILNENDNEDNDDDYDSDDDYDDDYYDSDNDDEITIKTINNNFKKIDKTKSFEDQIDIFKKIPWLNDYWYMDYYEDNKETNLRLFKLRFAHVLNYMLMIIYLKKYLVKHL